MYVFMYLGSNVVVFGSDGERQLTIQPFPSIPGICQILGNSITTYLGHYNKQSKENDSLLLSILCCYHYNCGIKRNNNALGLVLLLNYLLSCALIILVVLQRANSTSSIMIISKKVHKKSVFYDFFRSTLSQLC